MAIAKGGKTIDRERLVAYNILRSVEEEDGFSNLELNKAFAKEDDIDKAFVRKLVYGVLERKLYLDFRLDNLLEKGVKSLKPEVHQILRMGAYQMEFMESVPDYAAIDTSVKLLPKKYSGLKGFVNGVLRANQRSIADSSNDIRTKMESLEGEEYLKVAYSCGEEVLDLLLNQYGYEETRNFLESTFKEYPLELRVNLGEISREEILDRLPEAKPSELTRAGISFDGSNITESQEYKDGLISIQSLGSCRIAELMGAKSGDLVIDICAAPGGKSLAMAEAMGNQGKIISMDISERRLSLLPREADRLGIEIIESKVQDGRIPAEDLLERADAVLADVPCSGLGVIGSKPEIKYKDINKGMAELIETQQGILETAAKYLKKGGRLVYSTCTLNKDENEKQVELFLNNHKEFKLLEEHLPLKESEGRGCFYMALMEKM